MIRTHQFKNASYLIFAMSGLLGGIAEIVWMYVYNMNGTLGLKEIGNAIAITLHFYSSSPYVGLLIHLSLSVFIGNHTYKFIVFAYRQDPKILFSHYFCSFHDCCISCNKFWIFGHYIFY